MRQEEERVTYWKVFFLGRKCLELNQEGTKTWFACGSSHHCDVKEKWGFQGERMSVHSFFLKKKKRQKKLFQTDWHKSLRSKARLCFLLRGASLKESRAQEATCGLVQRAASAEGLGGGGGAAKDFGRRRKNKLAQSTRRGNQGNERKMIAPAEERRLWAGVRGKGVKETVEGGPGKWVPQDLRVAQPWAGEGPVAEALGWPAGLEGHRGMGGPGETTFSKVHESPKPQKATGMAGGQRRLVTGLRDGEGSAAGEGKGSRPLCWWGVEWACSPV